MPYNGSGVYNLPAPEYPAVPGTDILAEDRNTIDADIQGALSLALPRDGQAAMTGNLDFGGFAVAGISQMTFSGVASVNGLKLLVADGAGADLSGTWRGTTQAPGTNNLTLATTAFVAAAAFSTALPGQLGNDDKLVTTNGSVASWTDILKAGTIKFADSADTTKRIQFNLAAISTATTRSLTILNRDAVLGPNMTKEVRSSGANVQIVLADIAKHINVTVAGFTQTFDTAGLQDGFWVRLENSSLTGIVTIASSDGLVNWPMYPGECRDFQYNGATLTSLVIKAYAHRFLAGAVWTKPPGYKRHSGKVGSGGNSGNKSSGGVLSQGGPGGGVFPFSLPDSQLGATETITVGAGGAAQTVASTAGNQGGTSSFGAWCVVVGGQSSLATAGSTQWGGAVSLNGTTALNKTANNISEFAADTATGPSPGIWAGGKADNSAAADSGGSIEGGAAGGGVAAAGTIRAPGTSRMAGNGGAASAAGSGAAGVFPCGGGGATQTGAASGAGANGFVDVWGEV